MKHTTVISIPLFSLMLSACDLLEESPTVNLTANTLNAEGFALQSTTSSVSASEYSVSLTSTSSDSCSQLVKFITTDEGSTEESVFSEDLCERIDITIIDQTSTHLILKGQLPISYSEDLSSYEYCSLIALPLDSEEGRAACISQQALAGRTPNNMQQWGTGLEIVGDTVYFSNESEETSSVYKWDGGDTTEVIFQSLLGEIDEIYSIDGENFLLFRENPGIGSDGTIIYGDLTNGFEQLNSFRFQPLRVGNKLFFIPNPNTGSELAIGYFDLSTGSYLDPELSGLTTECVAPNYGAQYFPIELQWTSDNYSYWISYSNSKNTNVLCRIDENGTVVVVDDTNEFDNGWQFGDKVALLGSSSSSTTLSFLDLSSETYDSTNRLSELSLLDVTNLRSYEEGIAITGTNSFGQVTTIYYNAATDSVETEPSNSQPYSNIIYLDE